MTDTYNQIRKQECEWCARGYIPSLGCHIFTDCGEGGKSFPCTAPTKDAVIEAAQKVAEAWHKRPHGLTVTNAIADSMDALAVLMPWQDAEETPNAQ